MKTPFIRYRPIKGSDGQGGTERVFDDGVYLWGSLVVHQNEVRIRNVDANEDVKVMDEIEVQE